MWTLFPYFVPKEIKYIENKMSSMQRYKDQSFENIL